MRPAAGLLVTLVAVSLLGGQGRATPVEPEIAYTDFKALVEQGKVEEIALQGGEMAGKLRVPVPLGPRGEPAARFRTRIPGFGDADLLPALQRQAVRLRVLEPGQVARTLAGLRVNEIMTWAVVTVGPDVDIRDAARAMHDRKLGALPVADESRVIGVITATDVIRAIVGTAGKWP